MRADADGRHANPSTLRPLVVVPHPNHSNHNGGQLQFGPDGLSTRAPGTAAARAISPTTPRTRIRAWASCCGSIPPLRVGSGLLDRPAQPVPILLRPGHGSGAAPTPSPTSGRAASTRSTTCSLAAAAGANFGWNDFEGFARSPERSPPRRAERQADQGPQHLRRGLRDDRRLRRPGFPLAPAHPPLRLRGLLHGQDPPR